MGRYDVWVVCDRCDNVHPTGISFTLDNGPKEPQLLSEFNNTKDLPDNIGDLTNNHTYCPATKEFFVQKDDKKIFLVPIT